MDSGAAGQSGFIRALSSNKSSALRFSTRVPVMTICSSESSGLDGAGVCARALCTAKSTRGSDALPAIEAVIDRAMAALGAEAVGIMQTLLDQTLEYTKIRKQFGRPLSANQVIRHRLADMAMQCDEARSMALRAALMADAEPIARSRAASGAKAKIGKCARFVAEQSVQLHGAMGVTEELDVGSYFKRLLAFDTLFGGSAHHYRRHAALGGRAVQAR